MKYSKRRIIQRRIIRYNDIIELSHFFVNLAEKQAGTCIFRAVFRDGSSVADHSSQVFEESCFMLKDIARLKFEYASADYKNCIELHLEEGLALCSELNGFEIISDDETWLNATYTKLSEFIEGIPKRSIFRISFSFPWVIANYVAIQVLSWKIMPAFGFVYGQRPLRPDGSPDPNYLFIPASAFFLIISLAFAVLTLFICILYPEQEFAFGVCRYPRRIRARKIVGWLLATIIIPVVLSFLL